MINFNYLKIIILGISILLISGCAPKMITKGEKFPKMYDQQPRSLLILPPMNESTDAEAKDYYMTTVEMPFALAGYYVLPVEMVGDILKQEGIQSTELLYNLPPDKLHEYFGADAVMYTRIKKWDVSYMVIASSLTVSIESEIISSKTSEKLWNYTGTVVVDLSGGNSGGGIAGLIVKAVVAAINTASADYVKYARVANAQLIYTLPVGPYHEMHIKDQSVQFFDQTPKNQTN